MASMAKMSNATKRERFQGVLRWKGWSLMGASGPPFGRGLPDRGQVWCVGDAETCLLGIVGSVVVSASGW
jgi:hypothetical protein